MSRYYEGEFEIEASEAACKAIAFEVSSLWQVEDVSWRDGCGSFRAQGYLRGGCTEEEFVKHVGQLLSPRYDGVRMSIRLTCLEDLPYGDYGITVGERGEACL